MLKAGVERIGEPPDLERLRLFDAERLRDGERESFGIEGRRGHRNSSPIANIFPATIRQSERSFFPSCCPTTPVRPRIPVLLRYIRNVLRIELLRIAQVEVMNRGIGCFKRG